MKNEKLNNLVGAAKKFTDKNSPHILTGMALAGLVSTTMMAFKAGPKAHDILESKRRDMEYVRKNDKEAKRTVMWETVKEMTPVVAPPIIMGGLTATCIIAADRISTKRIAVLSAAYTLTESALHDYQAKVEDMLGERKAQKIKDAIVQDKVTNNPPPSELSQQVMIAGGADVLCMDQYTGRYFRSTAQKIEHAMNKLSSDCASDMYVSLNDLYDYLDPSHTQIPPVPMGNDFGWNADNLVHGQLPITITATTTPDMVPCLCINYDIWPRMDFRNLH